MNFLNSFSNFSRVFSKILSWTKLGQDIDGTAADSEFGASVAINDAGTIVVVGAPKADPNGTNSGKVTAYQYNGTSWIKIGQDINGDVLGGGQLVNGRSGYSVSINAAGNRIAIGAPIDFVDAGGSGPGQVKIYEYSSSTWNQLGSTIKLTNFDYYFGFSVSLNAVGDIVAIGDRYYSSERGRTKIYQYNGSSWNQLGADINGQTTYEWSGYSVSLNASGDTVAIGSPAISSGLVKIYKYISSSWTQLGSTINGEASVDGSGNSVSLNAAGDIVAIGADDNFGTGAYAGHVRVYQYNGSSWIKLGQDIDGEAAQDLSGHSVSLNAAGDIVAIGAKYNDGNGSNSGHTRIYKYDGSSWIKLNQDIDGEAADDYSGYSVSINSSGDTVAIGAPMNSNAGGSRAGQVRVYKLT
jgi:hypothetical protein